MTKKYIKTPISEMISELGGATVQFVEKITVPLDGAIDEALAGNYCIGNKVLIMHVFLGLMKSMAEGVARDGHARQIGDFLTIYPRFKGEVDLDKGFDPQKNSVRICARLLNEMELDITGWSFEDVTPGKRGFTLDTVKAGEEIGVYRLGEAGEFNGNGLPTKDEGVRIDWSVEGTDMHGTLEGDDILSGDVSRTDVSPDALAELRSAEYDGKTIVFTVRGNFSKAKKSAVLKFDAPAPTVEKIASEGKDGIVKGEAFAAIGTGLSFGEGDSVTVKWTEGGEEKSLEVTPTETTPTKMSFDAVDAFDAIPDDTELTFEFALGGETVEGETELLAE